MGSLSFVREKEGWDPKIVHRLKRVKQDNGQEPLPFAQDRQSLWLT